MRSYTVWYRPLWDWTLDLLSNVRLHPHYTWTSLPFCQDRAHYVLLANHRKFPQRPFLNQFQTLKTIHHPHVLSPQSPVVPSIKGRQLHLPLPQLLPRGDAMVEKKQKTACPEAIDSLTAPIFFYKDGRGWVAKWECAKEVSNHV